jgi:hypothetical protein
MYTVQGKLGTGTRNKSFRITPFLFLFSEKEMFPNGVNKKGVLHIYLNNEGIAMRKKRLYI